MFISLQDCSENITGDGGFLIFTLKILVPPPPQKKIGRFWAPLRELAESGYPLYTYMYIIFNNTPISSVALFELFQFFYN